MKSNMSGKNHVSGICKFIEQAGAKIDAVEKSKHCKIKFTYHGKPMMLVTSNTPSDWRTEQNSFSRVKRMMRAAAAVPATAA